MELPADKALGRALDVLLLCNELKNAVTAGEEMNQLKGLYITNVCLSEGVDRYAVYVTTIYNYTIGVTLFINSQQIFSRRTVKGT